MKNIIEKYAVEYEIHIRFLDVGIAGGSSNVQCFVVIHFV